MAAVRRGAWVALRYVTTIFFLGVVVQFFLVGFGLFAMKHGATIDNAKLARPPPGPRLHPRRDGGALLMLDPRAARLAGTPQAARSLDPARACSPSCSPSSPRPATTTGLGMFHPVNAIILLALSGRLAHYAWTTGKNKEAAEAPAAVPIG